MFVAVDGETCAAVSADHGSARTRGRSRVRLWLISGWISGVLLAIPLSPVGAFQTDQYQPFKPAESTLQQYTAELKNVLRFQPDAGRLLADFATSGNEARSELQSASAKVNGAGGSSSSSSGGDSWSTSIRGQKLTVTAGFGRQHVSPYNEPVLVADNETFYMQLDQLTGDRPRVLVTATPDHMIRARIDDMLGAFTFRFEQLPDGSVRCIEIGPDCLFVGNAKSFDELAAAHPDYVSKRLTRLFQFAGMGPPPTRYSQTVQEMVLASLLPRDPERQARFETLIKPLDSPDFGQREQATEKVEEKFEEWESEIKTAMGDSRFSAEVRSRLKSIFEANVDKDAQAFQSLAVKAQLTEDPEYLAWLLQQVDRSAEEPEFRELRELHLKVIIDRLEKITGQDLGSDIAAWKAAVGQSKQTEGKSTPVDQSLFSTAALMNTDGTLDSIADRTAQLLQLRLREGQLEVDRDHWKEQLGGSTVQEVCEEVRQAIKARNLPTAWFQPGGGSYPEQTVEFPQVVFARMTADQEVDKEVAQRLSAYSRYTQNTANREFMGTKLVGMLKTHQADRRQVFIAAQQGKIEPIKQEFLQLQLNEPQEERREIWFFDDRQGNLVVGLRFGRRNCELRFIQRSEADEDGNRFFLIDARGNRPQYFRADSFASMVQQHGSLWNEQVAPLFAKVGIAVVSPANVP